MEHAVEGDQIASTQSETLISQATTTIDPNGAEQNDAVLRIASNLDWLVSMLKAAQNPSKVSSTVDDSPLSTADLVKILEIALAEIRANQNFAFSVLGFAIVAGTIIQRTHFGGSGFHGDVSPWLWGAGTLFCAGAAVWTAISKHHLTPLSLFVKASVPGEVELVLTELRSALNKANTAVEKARGPKILVCIGIAFVVFALGVEFWKCISTASSSTQNSPTAERKLEGR
jgi:hypothetical protein